VQRGAFPQVLYGLLVMAAGEWLALRTLLRGHASSTDKAWVVGALVAAGLAVMLPALRETVDAFAAARANRSPRDWILEAVTGVVPLALIVCVVVSS
jgi:hypothetical protein